MLLEFRPGVDGPKYKKTDDNLHPTSAEYPSSCSHVVSLYINTLSGTLKLKLLMLMLKPPGFPRIRVSCLIFYMFVLEKLIVDQLEETLVCFSVFVCPCQC